MNEDETLGPVTTGATTDAATTETAPAASGPVEAASTPTGAEASGAADAGAPASAPVTPPPVAGDAGSAAATAPVDGAVAAGSTAPDMAGTLPTDAASAGMPAPDMAAPAVPDMPDAGWLQTASDLISAGGPVVVILLVMSVVALAIVLAKLWQFAGAGLTDARPANRVLAEWRQGRRDAALAAAENGRGPSARALAAALACELPAEVDRAREASWVAASRDLEAARSWLRPLEVIASLAPLLGLFGTVLGMISAFARLEEAGSRVDPGILSGGIWEALLTTAVGLAIAIPAVMALNWFERRVERAESLAERSVSELFSIAPPVKDVVGNVPVRRPEPFAGEVRFRAVAPG